MGTARGLVGLVLIGCADSADKSDGFSPYSYTYDGDYGTTDPTPQSPPLPPEQEAALPILEPAQNDAYVFVANPERDTLTRITVADRSVRTVPVGVSPKVVQTTADGVRVVVLNQGDDTVSILDADTLDEQRVDVRDDRNRLVLSPDSAYAAVWQDTALAEEEGTLAEGLQSFNEITLVELAGATATTFAVGFNPRQVAFTPDGSLAIVVSDAYLATLDLSVAEPTLDLIELAPTELDVPPAEEVVVAPDGSFAWIRQFGTTDLLVVDLQTGALSRRAAGIQPTDLDCSPDGQTVAAVARGSRELWLYDAQDPDADPQVIGFPDSPFGQIAFGETGDRAVLYTTVTVTPTYGLWTMGDNEVRERSLVKSVRGVTLDPTGQTLVVLHPANDGPQVEPTFVGAPAVSVVDLDSLVVNPIKLPAEVEQFVHDPAGDYGYFILEDEPLLAVVDYGSLLHDQITLRSIPEFVGVIGDAGTLGEAWVSQKHPLGRLSFYDPVDDTLATLTGFELNAEID